MRHPKLWRFISNTFINFAFYNVAYIVRQSESNKNNKNNATVICENKADVSHFLKRVACKVANLSRMAGV